MNRLYGQVKKPPGIPHSDSAGRGVPWIRRKLAPQQPIFHQGDERTLVYMVKSGFVRLYSLLANGRSQVIGFKSPGEFVAFEYGAKHRLSSQAVTATELHRAPTAAFFAAASTDPQFLLKLYRWSCDDLSRSHELILTIAKRDAEASIAAFIIDIDASAAARGVKSDLVSLPMLRGDIANYLGLAFETISRIFTHFKKRGLIEVRGRYGIRLIDRRVLKAIAKRNPSERRAIDLKTAERGHGH